MNTERLLGSTSLTSDYHRLAVIHLSSVNPSYRYQIYFVFTQ